MGRIVSRTVCRTGAAGYRPIMRIPTLQQLPDGAATYVTACLDVTRTTESAGHEIEMRWDRLRRTLLDAGTAPDLLDRIAERVIAPTGRSGATGRLVVAADDEVALDLVLPARPSRDEAVTGPAPHLLPVFRALADRVPYVLAEVDRTGADITVVDEWDTAVRATVDGDHDVIHKVPGGGLAHRRIQARAEDSWARNAAEVAAELDRTVARHRPGAVLLDGDPNAVTDVLEAAGDAVTRIAGRLRSGNRADGASTESRDAEIAGALVRVARERRTAWLDRFRTEEGRQAAAVQSLPDVVAAARAGQVAELLLADDPTSTHQLLVGDQPLALGETESDVRALGSARVRRTRADTALVWAVVRADAGVTLLDPDQSGLRDGIGAVLRWSDRSTPHDAVPSKPGTDTSSDRPGVAGGPAGNC